MAAAVAASKACFSQLAFSGATTSKCLNRVARPLALPRRSNFAVRASLETKERQTAIVPSVSHENLAGTVLAGSLFSTLSAAPSAHAAQEVMTLATQEFAQIAEGADYRPLILLVVLAPAVGWVLFNILPPALKQLQRMLNNPNRGVVGAVGLGAGASLLALPEAAEAAQEFAQLAEGADYRPLILLVVLAPAVGWVLFNILPPALKQLQRMLNNPNRGIVGAVGLGAGASLLALPESADAAQEFAQLAEGADYRPLILLLVLAPALGWVAFNILKPALRQLETAINKNK